MPSLVRKSFRGILYLAIVLVLYCLTATSMVRAQSPSTTGEATAEELDAAERTRVLEAQRLRQDERASLWGGTGLVFTRTAVLLPRKHLNVSAFFNYSHYEYIQGWQDTTVLDRDIYELNDPREDDMELNIVANYGLSHYVELGAFVNVFLDNEQDDSDHLHMRKPGIGWSGLNVKFRFMDIDKDGLGIASTFFVRLPSPQKNADITSENPGWGAEINVSFKLIAINEYLEKFTVHGNFGWAQIDYFHTGLAGLYQFARTDESEWLLNHFYGRDDAYGDYLYSDLFPSDEFGDPIWDDVDDVEMTKTYFSTDHYTGSFALEYKPIRGLSTGFELVGYRMIKFSDDNLQIAPFVTYTFRQIPFVKKVRKDLITVSLAGNFGLRSMNRSSPEWGIVSGISWHTDLIF